MLNWRKRFIEEEVTCMVCADGKEENLGYFLKKCSVLSHIRRAYGLDEAQLEQILFFKETLNTDN